MDRVAVRVTWLSDLRAIQALLFESPRPYRP